MTRVTFFGLALTVLISPVAQSTYALRMMPFVRRDDSSPPPLETLDMPHTFDSQGRYSVQATMVSPAFSADLSQYTGD